MVSRTGELPRSHSPSLLLIRPYQRTELGCWPMMAQEHGGQLPGLLRLGFTWHIWRRLETLGEGILHEMTWLSVLPPGPRMIKEWFSGVTYPLGKIDKIQDLERTSSSRMLRIFFFFSPFIIKLRCSIVEHLENTERSIEEIKFAYNPISQNNYILDYISF